MNAAIDALNDRLKDLRGRHSSRLKIIEALRREASEREAEADDIGRQIADVERAILALGGNVCHGNRVEDARPARPTAEELEQDRRERMLEALEWTSSGLVDIGPHIGKPPCDSRSARCPKGLGRGLAALFDPKPAEPNSMKADAR